VTVIRRLIAAAITLVLAAALTVAGEAHAQDHPDRDPATTETAAVDDGTTATTVAEREVTDTAAEPGTTTGPSATTPDESRGAPAGAAAATTGVCQTLAIAPTAATPNLSGPTGVAVSDDAVWVTALHDGHQRRADS
jgi:hypothetical protein